MILGIDATNIRSGGGVTHLVEILTHAQPESFGFKRVIVWSNSTTLNKIPDRVWLEKSSFPFLDRSFAYRSMWRLFMLRKQISKTCCDIIFVPGGTDSSGFRPLVSMSQNMLPFEWKELVRYGFSLMTLKLLILRYTQGLTFKKSTGVIFLTNYARDEISKKLGKDQFVCATIPHGVGKRFFSHPQKNIHKKFDKLNPYKIVYISIVDMYKHQWSVAKAVSKIRSYGIPVSLDLIGPAYGPALSILENILNIVDPKREFIIYRGFIPYDELHNVYKNFDINVFASSCENLPNILLEAMAEGIPIACSNRGPMPEILGDAGVYFDPEKPDEIADAIMMFISSQELRFKKASMAYDRVKYFEWERCSNDTFQFLAQVAKDWKISQLRSKNI